MATTLIVSDIHLGARNSQTRPLLDLLETDFDRLIINGDIIDHMNFKRFRSGDWEALGRLREISSERRLVMVRGNHDGGRAMPHRYGLTDVVAGLVDAEIVEDYRLWVGRRQYLVLHGDQFDRTLNMTWIGDWCDRFYRQMQRISRPVARWLKMRYKHWGGVVGAVRRGAVLHALGQGFQGVIAGHTHFDEENWIDGCHYLNTGCWTDLPCTYVHIEDRRIELRQWQTANISAPMRSEFEHAFDSRMDAKSNELVGAAVG